MMCISVLMHILEQNGDTSGVEGENFDWNTDDELEVNDFSLSSCSSLTPTNGEAVVGRVEVKKS